ncbi:MAG: phage portal protein [Dehalococcoidia bacterium]
MVNSMLERAAPPIDEAAEARGAVERAKLLLKYHAGEMRTQQLRVQSGVLEQQVGLELIHRYLLGAQPHPSVPAGASPEVRRLAQMSRVNVLDLIISSVAQAMYVDGYRGEREADNAPAWDVWQDNRMDKRQSGIHRAALAYGAAYVTVLPGEPVPVIKGYSPRRMVALYGDDDDWPMMAMAIEPSGSKWALSLFDETSRYRLTANAIDEGATITFLESERHGAPVTPVVRYLNVVDLDEDHQGEIERLIPLQDQIDETTFDLLVAQKYAAFRQRWVIGWTTASEDQKLKASAARLWTFDDPDVKVGEFGQTELKGYLDSREASLRHAATISQTPAHELIGQMVNLSAEALVAAEASQRRKVTERQMSFGESHEQMLALAGTLGGFDVVTSAQVRWRDTESRALAATVDALGKMVTMLGVPASALWERIPGVTQQDIERWETAVQEGDVLSRFGDLLARQENGGAPPDGETA